MNKEMSKSFENLDCFRAGLVEACAGLDLFGEKTQEVMELCFEVDGHPRRGEPAAVGIQEYKRLCRDVEDRREYSPDDDSCSVLACH